MSRKVQPKSGGTNDGGKEAVGNKCKYFCSTKGYCGDGAGYRRGDGWSDCRNCALECVENGIDYRGPGNDLKPSSKNHKYAADSNVCQSVCQGRNGCTHFTWNKKSKKCHLKTGSGKRKKYKNAI